MNCDVQNEDGTYSVEFAEKVVLADWELSGLGGGGDLLGRWTALAGLAWENNQLKHDLVQIVCKKRWYLWSVLLEALNIGLETLDGGVASSVINGNSELTGLTDGETGTLELGWGETLTSTDADVVTLGWASDSGAEKTASWAWGDGGSLKKRYF